MPATKSTSSTCRCNATEPPCWACSTQACACATSITMRCATSRPIPCSKCRSTAPATSVPACWSTAASAALFAPGRWSVPTATTWQASPTAWRPIAASAATTGFGCAGSARRSTTTLTVTTSAMCASRRRACMRSWRATAIRATCLRRKALPTRSTHDAAPTCGRPWLGRRIGRTHAAAC